MLKCIKKTTFFISGDSVSLVIGNNDKVFNVNTTFKNIEIEWDIDHLLSNYDSKKQKVAVKECLAILKIIFYFELNTS